MKHLPSEERRKRIVRGAMQAFARTGFKGTRSRDLAKAAGVSEALIFKHFPNKRALQKAIIEERIRQTGEFLPAGIHGAPVAEALEGIAARVIELSERDPGFMRLLYYSGLEREPLSPMFFERRVTQNISEVAGLFRGWIRKGWLRRSLDPRLCAWSFMGCVFQLMAARHIFGVRRMADRPGSLSRKVADLFLRGVIA
jgi:TetR/AcrR family transcriptional regulator